MPIRPDLRHFYREAWRETRTRIIARACGRCEQCRKPNGEIVYTYTNSAYYYSPAMAWTCTGRDGWWTDHTGSKCERWPGKGLPRKIRCVLTVAHLNHVAGDDREENLKALCQWCHLNYDKLHHHETRAARKDAARPLLEEKGKGPSPMTDSPSAAGMSIQCLLCGLISHHPRDVEERYCGRCHSFHQPYSGPPKA